MIKAIYSTGLISLLLFFSLGNAFGQESQNNLPLYESENKVEINSGEEYPNSGLNHQNQLKKTEKPTDTQIKREKMQNSDDIKNNSKEENRKNSILKSSSSLVTVFYVLVSYLFSGPLDNPSSSNQTL